MRIIDAAPENREITWDSVKVGTFFKFRRADRAYEMIGFKLNPTRYRYVVTGPTVDDTFGTASENAWPGSNGVFEILKVYTEVTFK
jgi:hypothetical protein